MSTFDPTLLSIGQASGIVVASVRLPDTYAAAVQYLTLYRSASLAGPWTQVDQRLPSLFSRWQNLFDQSPVFGALSYYQASLDDGNTSGQLTFIPVQSPPAIAPSAGISAAALGPYPLLGSDVYLDPTTGEAVIGPNGDMLAVNGLELLAQDLRTRFMTEKGELLLHPNFGLGPPAVIGSGQSAAEAQYLQTLIIDACLDEPRVSSVQSVQVVQTSFDSWAISVVIIAIGQEDAQQLNIVFPYYTQ